MLTVETSQYLPEFTNVQKTVPLSFRARWIEPILHPATKPFEPWIRSTTVVVRERAWYWMGNTIICHPNNAIFVKDAFNREEFRWVRN